MISQMTSKTYLPTITGAAAAADQNKQNKKLPPPPLVLVVSHKIALNDENCTKDINIDKEL